MIVRAVVFEAWQVRKRTPMRRRAAPPAVTRPTLNVRTALAGILLLGAIGLPLVLLRGGGSSSKRPPLATSPAYGLASARNPERYRVFDPQQGHYSRARLGSCFDREHALKRSGARTLIVRLPKQRGKARLTLRFYRSWAEAQRAGLMSRTAPSGRKAIGNVLVIGAVTDPTTVRALVSCFSHRVTERASTRSARSPHPNHRHDIIAARRRRK